MRSITIIARNTFREAVRDRILYNLVIFVLLVIGCAVLLGDLTDGQEARTIVNISLSAMLLFGVFISIFVGVGLVSKEIEKRTVFAIFAKPVSRRQFIVGKYLGLCLTLLLNTFVMGLGVAAALLYVGDRGLVFTIWWAIYLIFLELTIITSIAIVFSSFSSAALSALLTFLVFIIGHLSTSLRDLGRSLGSEFARIVLDLTYYVFPNLHLFVFRTEAANGLVPNVEMVLGATAYAVVYVAIMLAIATFVFQRRNFK